MRIAILTNKLPYPPKDGGSIATLNMITDLSDAGHDVTCLSLNTNKHRFPLEKIPTSLSDKINFQAVDCNSSIRPVKMLGNLLFSKTPYIAERFKEAAFTRKLETILGKDPYDIVQLEGPYLGHYIQTVRQKSSALISFRAHNVEYRIWERKAANEKWGLKKAYLRNMAKRLKNFEVKVACESDCLVCISPLDEQAFLDQGVDKAHITIPTGISLKNYPASNLPEAPSVFFIGALDWLPNQEGLKWFLDKVLDDLRKKLPDVSFHVAGRNAPPHFEKLLKRKGVNYHGEIEDACAFMLSYRIMVAPLFTGSGIRIKILEALALGRPVVTTSIGIEGIPATNGVEVMVSDDPKTFKNQIVKLCSDEQEASAMLSKGRQVIQENFDTFGLSNRLTQFFKEQV